MGRINVELEDELHNKLRLRSRAEGTAIKTLVSDAVRDEYGDVDVSDVDGIEL